MKHIMKTALACVLVLAMLIVPMTAAAATGDYETPYVLPENGMALNAEIAPEATVYFRTNSNDGAVISIGITNASAKTFMVQYGRQTYYPDAAGKVSFTMNAALNTYSIYNNGTASVYTTTNMTAGAPVDTTGTMDNPELLTLEDPYQMGAQMAVAQYTFEAGNQGRYYKVIAPGEGVINVSVSACDEDYNDIGWQYFANNKTQGKYGDNHWSDDNPVVDTEQVPVKAGDEVEVFAIPYNPANVFTAPAGIVTVVVSFSAAGSYDCPVEATLGANAASVKNGNGYYYTWTAAKDGTATFTMNTATNWEYRINGIPVDPENYADYYYGDTHWSDDDPVVRTESIEMKAGETLDIFVNTYNPNGAAPSGTVNWTLSFTAGEVGDDDDQGGQGGSGDEGGDDEINYAVSDTALEVGTKDYAVDSTYPYTVYVFSPEETGKYTVSTENGILGIVSYTDMWVQHTPSADNVNAESVVWDCTAVGQGIYVAVAADADVTITVEREDLEEKEEIPWIIYENVVTPEAFVLEGNFDDMMYVETFDDILDKAVLGEDGFYHLNDAYGPILYACLNDPLMNLADAWGYGQLKEVLVDEDGNIVERTDFYYAFEEYYACVDPDSGLYPLTVDIIEMFTRIGAYHNWYGENGFLGGDLEDAWMFACYYNEGETFEPGATKPAGGTTTTTKTDSPSTADTSDAMNMLFVAVLAAGAVVTAVATKKAKA